MRLIALSVLGLVLTLSLIGVSKPVASSESIYVPQVLVVAGGQQAEVSAKAFSVIDIETGDLLFSHQAEVELPIASITKLFTASEIIDNVSLDKLTTVSEEDVLTEGRAGKLEAGQKYEVRELLFPLLLESSNDAAATLGRMIGDVYLGDRLMADTSGLSSKNMASANRLSAEVRSLYLTNKYIFDITTLEQYVGKNTGWVNNSPVYDLEGYMGGKHGYTVASNRTLAAVFFESPLQGRELAYVILGSDDVRADLLELRSMVERSVHIE